MQTRLVRHRHYEISRQFRVYWNYIPDVAHELIRRLYGIAYSYYKNGGLKENFQLIEVVSEAVICDVEFTA